MGLFFSESDYTTFLAEWSAASLATLKAEEKNNLDKFEYPKIAAQQYFLVREALRDALQKSKTIVTVRTKMTRPNDTPGAYSVNDVVSNSTATTTLIELANCVDVAGGSGLILGCRLLTKGTGAAGTGSFRVHMFNASNPTVAVDHAQNISMDADLAKKIGYLDLAAMATSPGAGTDMSTTQDLNTRIAFSCAASSKSLFAYLEVLTAFTPTALQEFTLELTVQRV